MMTRELAGPGSRPQRDAIRAMLYAYRLSPRGLDRHTVQARGDLTEDVLWLDMVDPDERERSWVQAAYGHAVHVLGALSDIEASARYFSDPRGDHVRLYFLEIENGIARNVDVGFTLESRRLYSLHAREVEVLTKLHNLGDTLTQPPADPVSILAGIEELRIDSLADSLERLHAELATLSSTIFAGTERRMQRLLHSLGRIEDINGKARLGMIENRRAIQAFGSSRHNAVDPTTIANLTRDVDSLLSHCDYLLQKIEFLMDSALGMINLVHARRLTIFTVLSAVLMPPTLIASIYGMNFRHMPELDWLFGYPMALLLMLAVALGPMVYLRHRKWL
jgi:magnesium transporter